MNRKELFVKYMNDVTNIALATGSKDGANVRAVSIGFDEQTPDRIYFVTFGQSAKAMEMKADPKVTFIPFPDKSDTEVTIRVHGVAEPADISVERIAELVARHLPEYGAQIPAMGEHAGLYQIRYESAEVSLGMNPPEVITF